jgi:hypothetical protein
MPKNIILATSIVALSLFNMSASMAAAGDLAKCYDKVIAACNKTNHAESCAESGMDQCDEVHPTPMVGGGKLKLRADTAPAAAVLSN